MHGSESYYVIGEGLLSDAERPRPTAIARPPRWPRRRRGAAAAPPFRFRRVMPKGTQLGEPTRKKLAQAMTAGGGGVGQIPAGFTYFGQFVDHDLTFDKTTVAFGQNVSAADLLQGRSPALDLDSLYGAGPTTRLGEVLQGRPPPQDGQDRGGRRAAAKQGFDLPRAEAEGA